MKRKVLITGSSGFVGKNIKEYLESRKEEYQLYCPSSKELNCIDEGEVERYIKEHSFDYILHFAVYGDGVDKSKDGTKALEYNLRIFLNFYKQADFYGKMYYTGSGAEYDKRFDIVNVREEEIGRSIPIDQYGLMKYTIHQMIEKSRNIYNFRLFGIFGKYEYYPLKYISNVCCKAIKGLPLSMRQNVYFDYLWVEDFCKMVEFFLNHEPKFHTYNMVSGEKISLKEICHKVVEISGKDIPIYICKQGMANEYTASNARFMEECKDFSYTKAESAIEKLYHWYQANEKEIDLYKLIY